MRHAAASRGIGMIAAALGLFGTPAAMAQTERYPSRAITIIVPFAPGGATDIVARLLGQRIGEDLGQSVVVDNRSGGAGNTGTLAAVKSTPDGHTLVLATTTQLINQYLIKSTPFDIFTDLSPVALIADAPEILAISARIPAKSLAEFTALARADAGGFNYGSAGLGSVPHLGGEILARATKAKMVHVPFRGSADAVKEVGSGNIHFTLATKASVASFVDAGLVRMIAIAAPRRLSTLPDLPTTAEAGMPGVELSNWFGIMAPRGVDPQIVATLNRALNKALETPAIASNLASQGIEPVKETPEYFSRRLVEDGKAYKALIAELGLQAN